MNGFCPKNKAPPSLWRCYRQS